MRILLGFMGTSRYELMATFPVAQPGTPDLAGNEAALDRVATVVIA
jgi:hypothetical protein